MIKMLHNADCSKSNCALQLLQDAKVELSLRDYIKEPLSADELRDLVRLLAVPILDLVRTNEPIFQAQYSGKTLSDEEWIAALVAHPILLQRPILIYKDKAVIGRPPEKVLRLITEQ